MGRVLVSQLRGTVFDSWRIMDAPGWAADLKCKSVDHTDTSNKKKPSYIKVSHKVSQSIETINERQFWVYLVGQDSVYYRVTHCLVFTVEGATSGEEWEEASITSSGLTPLNTMWAYTVAADGFRFSVKAFITGQMSGKLSQWCAWN